MANSSVDKSIEEALYHIDKLKEDMSDLCSDLDQLYTKKVLNSAEASSMANSATLCLTTNLNGSEPNESFSEEEKEEEENEYVYDENDLPNISARFSACLRGKSTTPIRDGGQHYLVEENNSSNRAFFDICSSYYDSIYKINDASSINKGIKLIDCATQTTTRKKPILVKKNKGSFRQQPATSLCNKFKLAAGRNKPHQTRRQLNNYNYLFKKRWSSNRLPSVTGEEVDYDGVIASTSTA